MAPTSGLLTPVRASLLVLALALAVHGPSVGHPFVTFDDPLYVYENPHVREGLTAGSVAWAVALERPGRDTYFHPLTWLSLMLDRELFGLRPWGFHLVNVLLHAVAALLLLHVLLAATGAVGPAAAAASLFAVHPVTVEAVAWVTERKTVLSAALGLAAVLLYVRARGAPGWRRLAGVAALQFASTLAKPIFVTLPALLLVLDFWPLRRLEGKSGPGLRAAVGRLVIEKAPLMAVSVGATALVLRSLRNVSASDGWNAPLGLRLANALTSLPRYLGDVAWPSGLTVYHPFPTTVPAAAILAAAAFVLAAIVIAGVAARRGRPEPAAGLAWFLVALAPQLGLTQAGLWPSRADRFLYLPLMGLAVAAAFSLARGWRGRRAALTAVACAAVAALGAAGVAQGRHWASSTALYERAVAVEPTDAHLRQNLAAELMKVGRAAEARGHLERAVRDDPTYVLPHLLLADLRMRDGDRAGAERLYRDVLGRTRDDYTAMFLLAELLRGSGRAGEALPLYRRVAELAPPDLAGRASQLATITSNLAP